ncbi:MAG: ribonuclease HI [Phototrophicales bacterium]|nr:MAG: ribonuclease HI [Phototrophicales bacterium]
MSERKPHVTIYTDGGCAPNPEIGGYGAVLIFDDRQEELSGGNPESTNNRMELTAAIVALKALDQPHTIDLYTDSSYLKNGITRWIDDWIRRNWRNVKNADLWQQLYVETEKHDITWHRVRGHADNRWNERAHQLASVEIRKVRSDADTANAPNELPDTPVKIYICGRYNYKKEIGGWGAFIIENGRERELSGVIERKTSSNQLSLIAATTALNTIQSPAEITVFTDNEYLQKGISQWVKGWIKNNWQTSTRKPVKNRELWEELIAASEKHTVYWEYESRSDSPHLQAAKLAVKDIKWYQ